MLFTDLTLSMNQKYYKTTVNVKTPIAQNSTVPHFYN